MCPYGNLRPARDSMQDMKRPATRMFLAAGLQAVLSTAAAEGRTNGFTIDAPGTEIRVTVRDDTPPARMDIYRRWLEEAARTVAGVHGRFPAPQARVILQPTSGGDAVEFGSVRRSIPPVFRIRIDPDAGLEAYRRDWIVMHEFSHLLIPYTGRRDRWFSEGLASYYQEVLLARAGIHDPRVAWQRLHDGLMRGVHDREGRGMTLRDLSPAMHQTRSYRRVYWTGAAYFLRVDVRLRTGTDGTMSLDRALAAFDDCCMPAERRWRAERIITRLDELLDMDVFRREYEHMIDAPAVPDHDGAYELLGIEADGNDIRLEGTTAQRALRDAIMQGGNPATDR